MPDEISATATAANDDIVLRGMGSFHVGGRVAEISGKPVRAMQRQPGGPLTPFDPNGQYAVEQMYVQYFLPRKRKGRVPLLLWHGGGLTGVTYESTPDGREGWVNIFLRYGWDVYNCDAMERGRSGFAPPEIWPDEPVFLPCRDPFERFRIGDGPGSWNPDPAKARVIPGNQFPVEAYANFMRQTVPRWLSTDDAVIAAYAALVDKLDPCVILAHSQGGAFSFRVAEQRPDKIKAIVAIEPATAGNVANAFKLKDVPVLMLFGDYVGQHPRWTAFKAIDAEYADAIKAAGGQVDWVDLPDLGIKGNSHMLMQDRNNAAIAAVIQQWLVRKGLSDEQ
jgi:pimeloyl-ACP methyl ester carboxylesterase